MTSIFQPKIKSKPQQIPKNPKKIPIPRIPSLTKRFQKKNQTKKSYDDLVKIQ